MDDNRKKILTEYISYLYSTSKSYDTIGKYIKHITDFLENSENINQRGYLAYRKNNAEIMARHPIMCDAIRDLLSFVGIGFKKREKTLKPLEKLSTISEKNKCTLNNFIIHISDNNDYSPHTINVYYSSVKKYFEYANDVTMENYKRFIKMMEEEGFAPQTISLRITALEKLSEYLKKPIKLKRPKMKRKLDIGNVPTDDEYNKLLDYLSTKSNKDYYFFVKVLGTTGARVSEFQQFTWEDIIAGEITLKGKGNKYRRFFFQKQLSKEVKEYALSHGKSGVFAVGRYGPITQRGLCGAMKEWGKHCNIDKAKMHPHAFRHFFAKMFVKKNKDIIQLADLLGHGSIDTTRIYLQRSYDEQKRDFNRNVTW